MYHITTTVESSKCRRLFFFPVTNGKTLLHGYQEPISYTNNESTFDKLIEDMTKQVMRMISIEDKKASRTIIIDPRKHVGYIDLRKTKELRELLGVSEDKALPLPINHDEFIELGCFFGEFRGSMEEEKIEQVFFNKNILLANAYFFSDVEHISARSGWNLCYRCETSERNICHRIVFGFVSKLSPPEEINMESLESLIERKKKELELLQTSKPQR
ncbi:MAG: hypothetical protein WC608_03925 [Parcubacteria group bacterium]